MKQYSLLLFLLLISIRSFALDITDSLGIINFGVDMRIYKQYVGQTFELRKTWDEELWKDYNVKDASKFDGVSFTIKKVSVFLPDAWYSNTRSYLQIIAEENGGKRKIKINASFVGGADYLAYANLNELPIVLTQTLEKLKRNIITVPSVRDRFEVIDATDNKIIWIKDQRTGEIFKGNLSRKESDIYSWAANQEPRFSLKSVERPKDSSIRYGEAITTIQEDSIYKYLYSDSIFKIVIFGHENGFHFVLENLTKNSIKVIWDESAFVGVNGVTSKIVHSGVKYSEMGSNQPPTVIIGGAKLIDSVIPVDNVEYDNTENDWITNPILSFQDLTDNLGEVRLMLPIQVKDVVNEYIFTFKVTNDYMLPVQDI